MSFSRQMGKDDVVCTYNGIYSAIKRKKKIAIFIDMDGPRDCHRE